jgi:hypothetical protein
MPIVRAGSEAAEVKYETDKTLNVELVLVPPEGKNLIPCFETSTRNVSALFVSSGAESAPLLHALRFNEATTWEDALSGVIATSSGCVVHTIEKVELQRLQPDGEVRDWIIATSPLVLKTDTEKEPILRVHLR